MSPKLTRREVVVAGGLGAAGAVTALPGQAQAASSVPGGATQNDLRLLNGLLSIERVLEYAYRRVLQSSALNASTRGVLQLALRHESEHAAVLEREAGALSTGLSPGAQAAARPKGSSAMSDVVTLLGDAHTPRDAVRVLTKVESLSQASYFNAVGELQSPHLSLLGAQILASEAQHWSLLLNLLTEGAMPATVPNPFIRGVAELST
jgi:hypothetical protein